jgi:hypothetical protein
MRTFLRDPLGPPHDTREGHLYAAASPEDNARAKR